MRLGGGDMRRTLNILQARCHSTVTQRRTAALLLLPSLPCSTSVCCQPRHGMCHACSPCVALCHTLRAPLPSPQSCHMANDEVGESAVYLTTGNPLPCDISDIMEWLLNKPLVEAVQSETQPHARACADTRMHRCLLAAAHVATPCTRVNV